MGQNPSLSRFAHRKHENRVHVTQGEILTQPTIGLGELTAAGSAGSNLLGLTGYNDLGGSAISWSFSFARERRNDVLTLLQYGYFMPSPIDECCATASNGTPTSTDHDHAKDHGRKAPRSSSIPCAHKASCGKDTQYKARAPTQNGSRPAGRKFDGDHG